MSKTEELQKINKQLKIYINQSSFISNSCRNKLIKIFADEFNVDLDIDNYKNVDISIKDDFKILYRDDLYESADNISSLEQVKERYNNFREKADRLLQRKEIDFQNRSNWNIISNLIIIICLILIIIIASYLGIIALLNGHYFDCLWFIVVVLPVLVPRLKDNLKNRFIEAKRFIKSKIKKVK